MKKASPELVLGTQMERHSAKRLGIPCSVISTPMHVQDVPARYSPQMGWEGANVIFDDWVHPLMMGPSLGGVPNHQKSHLLPPIPFVDCILQEHLEHALEYLLLNMECQVSWHYAFPFESLKLVQVTLFS